jgi:hypothetical protein
MVSGKYGSLQLDDDDDEKKDHGDEEGIKQEDDASTPRAGGGRAYFEALKEDSKREYEQDEESSVVLDDIPLPVKLAPLLKRLTDSVDLSEEDILAVIFIIRIADAMHR